MPWTLYRYIFLELLKVLTLSTLVLILIVSLVAAIEPITDGMFSPWAIARFVLYMAPTMLAYVLPFAGAFAATLVFIRMASDNEILLCAASGMSYRAILLPVFVLGLVLMMGLFALSNFALPHFYQEARRAVEADMISVLVHQLNENDSFEEFADTVVYADRAERRDPPAAEQDDGRIMPDEWVRLSGTAVGQVDSEGRLEWEVTAQRADILLYRDAGQSWATIEVHGGIYYDPNREQLLHQDQVRFIPFRLPSPLRDNPKFFSYPELRLLEREPEHYDRVRTRKDALVRAVSVQALRRQLNDALADGQLELRSSAGHTQDTYRITAPIVESTDDRIDLRADDNRPVHVVHHRGTGPPRQYEAQHAELELTQPSLEAQAGVHARLYDVRVYDDRPDRATGRSEILLPRLYWSEPLFEQPLSELSTAELLGLIERERMHSDSQQVADAVARLIDRLDRLAYRIIGQLHDRAASAVACLLLLIFASVLSIHLRNHMPLAVFFWSFVLAIVTTLLIYAGERTARDPDMPIVVGLTVLWSGNIAVLLLTIALYRKLIRN